MRSIVVPADAFHRPEWFQLLAGGAQPGDSILEDEDGTLIVARYPDARQARLIRRGWAALEGCADGGGSEPRARVRRRRPLRAL